MSSNSEPLYDGLGHHISPLRVYIAVFGALLLFTVLTYAVSFAGLGPAALPVAMLVACVKATLVVTFFMHLKYDEKFNRLVFLSSFFFMGVFFIITLTDVATRAVVDPVEGKAAYERDFPDSAVRPTRANELRSAAAAAEAPAAEEAPADAPAAED